MRKLNLPGADGPTNNSAPTAVVTQPTVSLQPTVKPASTAVVAYQPGKLPVTLDEVGQIGATEQQQIAAVTQNITGIAKVSDMEGMGKLLSDTLVAAKGYDPKNLFKDKGVGGWFKGLMGKAESIRTRFDSVDGGVQKLVAQVDQRVNHFRARVGDLDRQAEATKRYHDSLDPQIDKLIATADWMDQNPPAIDPNDPQSAQFAQNWTMVAGFARKRADDLKRAKVLAQMQLAQIEQMKTNSISLAQKFSDIKVTTIPALQNTFTLYIINLEQKKGAEFADQIDTMTNEAIQQGAALLGQNTVAINTSLQRSNISLESLQSTFDALTKSMDDAKRIADEGAQRRATELPQIEQLSRDLMAKQAQR